MQTIPIPKTLVKINNLRRLAKLALYIIPNLSPVRDLFVDYLFKLIKELDKVKSKLDNY